MAVSHARYLAAYEALSTVEDAERLSREPDAALSFDALLAILSQKQLALTKRTDAAHRAAAAGYVRRFLRGESLVGLARSVGAPPTKLARLVLEAHLGASRGREVGALLRNPSALADARLRAEVAAAVEADALAGPYADAARRLIGLEYEQLLEQKLRAIGVPFLTEGDLRARGDAKTPDALLAVPLLVRGRVVNWVDSKATFGDAASHAEYRAQFSSYLHRFDAGLVLYWFGYDADVDDDPRVLLAADLRPSECVVMACAPQPPPALDSPDAAEHRQRRRLDRWGLSPGDEPPAELTAEGSP
jgi:hypothetical protein